MTKTGKSKTSGRWRIWERSGFRGGIHITDGRDKKMSCEDEIVDYEPETVCISMAQSGKNRHRPLVKEGDYVHAGQLIGEPETFTAAAIHSGISGKVEKAELHTDSDDTPIHVCVIRRTKDGNRLWGEGTSERSDIHLSRSGGKTNGQDETEEKSRNHNPQIAAADLHCQDETEEKPRNHNPQIAAADLHCQDETEEKPRTGETDCRKRKSQARKDYENYRKRLVDLGGISREEILDSLEKGGIVGMGGAGFPVFRKYAADRRIHTLLINGAECEPYLTCDHRLMLEHGMEILNGARLLARCASAGKTLICIEANKPDAAAHLKKLLREDFSQVEVVIVPDRYPQGGERQLIRTTLGTEVPKGGLPMDIGVIVSNVATARAAADCILGGKPLTHRCVTVSGLVRKPGNFMVPAGTSWKELAQLCQGVLSEKNRVILGGPMTGICVAEDWDGTTEIGTVDKTAAGLIILERRDEKESPCIRCGACVQVCPAGLIPFQIDFAWLKGDRERCKKLYADQCIVCGCCSFICPAKRELTHRIAMARKEKRTDAENKDQKGQSKTEVVFRTDENISDAREKRPADRYPPGPYLRSRNTSRMIMLHVLISLLPTLTGSIYFFGPRSLLLMAAATASCVLSELFWQAVRKEPVTAADGSAAVTGMLLALSLPVSTPVWAAAAAGIFAIIPVKQFFGGIGNNLVNPALMGRLFLMTVWPNTVAASPLPQTLAADGLSSATALPAVKSGTALSYSYWQMFVGEIPGTMGETGKLLLLADFLYLCRRRLVNVRAALSYIGTVTLTTFMLGPEGLFTGDILGNLLGGGLILGGFYMLTDYSFSSGKGYMLFGAAAGIATGLLRIYGKYPESVCYGILAANCLSGLMARMYRTRVYGTGIYRERSIQES